MLFLKKKIKDGRTSQYLLFIRLQHRKLSYDQNTHISTYSFKEFTETEKDGQCIGHSSSSTTITYDLNDIEPWPGDYYGKVALVENYTFTETPLIHVPAKVQDIQSYVTAECIRMLQEGNNMDISHQLMLFLTRLGEGALSLGQKIHDEISQTLRVVYILYNMETTTTEGINGNRDTDAEQSIHSRLFLKVLHRLVPVVNKYASKQRNVIMAKICQGKTPNNILQRMKSATLLLHKKLKEKSKL